MRDLVFFFALLVGVFAFSSARAGLDLGNQREIFIPKLDLNNDGRIHRTEVAEYMFFYFDYDGNETLTKGEYHKAREIAILPYEAEAVAFIDLDNNGEDDAQTYTTETFLRSAMVGEYEGQAEEGLKALDFLDIYFLRLDKDKSRGIELDEWQKHYQKHAVNKPNLSPKAADNDYYGN